MEHSDLLKKDAHSFLNTTLHMRAPHACSPFCAHVYANTNLYLSMYNFRDRAGGPAAVNRWENKLNTASIKFSKVKTTNQRYKRGINNARLARNEDKKQWKRLSADCRINDRRVAVLRTKISELKQLKDQAAARLKVCSFTFSPLILFALFSLSLSFTFLS